ncbi:MAG: hypothetical protein WC700_04125 [Gemmatimonadaceae bacterium]|jgi:hypothetical protein
MRPATADEYLGLLIAGLIFLAVLVVSFMCLQLYNLRKPLSRRRCADNFMSAAYYSPACGSEWAGRRRAECRGVTSGVMPSIEPTAGFGQGVCGGLFGVPPP